MAIGRHKIDNYKSSEIHFGQCIIDQNVFQKDCKYHFYGGQQSLIVMGIYHNILYIREMLFMCRYIG